MIVETALTKYLKRNFGNNLSFNEFADVTPPTPARDANYLMYIHIPFCEELCPYCSFNRYVFNKDLAEEYFRALNLEIQMYKDLGFDFKSVYVGGGTPTVMPLEINSLLTSLKKKFSVREISLETNPNHLNDDIVQILVDSGVNRLSVGVQSFDDSMLMQMSRFHKYGSGREIKERLARVLGRFDTLNVDMIFNFPTQTIEMLQNDLATIKDLRSDQVTFYPLMVSDITKSELARRFGSISYRQEKLFYNEIYDSLSKGYTIGTAWCFSRKKSMIDEYIVDYDEYVGVGSGSFGYINGQCLANTFSVPDYIALIKAGKFPLMARKEFSPKERARYYFMMRLFGSSLDIDAAEKVFSGKFQKLLWKEILGFRLFGSLQRNGKILRLTRKGLYLWVIMMREFFTGVNNFREICRATSRT
ncbi:MAG: coproporphyrinogen III oxidase family protein [Deltaproteobacteria bacterium]|nr:coproporphyrinogen III oxidase family protein [Deltaproteobacteria bacterium]